MEVGKILKHRYTVSIAILALLVVLNQVLIQIVVANEVDASRVINVAGKQRMYSQQINKATFGLYAGIDASERVRYVQELKKVLPVWKDHQDALQGKESSIALPVRNSREIQEIYDRIQDDFDAIYESSQRIMEITDRSVYDKTLIYKELRKLSSLETSYLVGMDQIVNQYEEDSLRRIEIAETLESWIFVSALFILAMVTIFVFVPTQKEIQNNFNEVQKSKSNLEKMFHAAPTAMLLISKKDGRVKMFNRLATQLFCDPDDEEACINLNRLQINPWKNRALLDRLFEEKTVDNMEIFFQHDDEKELIMHLSANVLWMDGEEELMIGLTDITKMKEAEELLKKRATTDHMTGLLNKQAGIQRMEEMLELAKQNRTTFTVCFADLDNLKQVNDTYGHEEGDFYIKTIGELLVKKTGINDVAFRYGGDEMIVVLDQCDRACAEKIVARIRKNLAKIEEKEQKPYPMHVSFGIADFAEGLAEDTEGLLALADAEMYENKKRYKESLGKFNPVIR